MLFVVLQMNSSDRVLLAAFSEINQMADRLQLPKLIPVSISILQLYVHLFFIILYLSLQFAHTKIWTMD